MTETRARLMLPNSAPADARAVIHARLRARCTSGARWMFVLKSSCSCEWRRIFYFYTIALLMCKVFVLTNKMSRFCCFWNNHTCLQPYANSRFTELLHFWNIIDSMTLWSYFMSTFTWNCCLFIFFHAFFQTRVKLKQHIWNATN